MAVGNDTYLLNCFICLGSPGTLLTKHGAGPDSNAWVQSKRQRVIGARAELWAGNGAGLPGQGGKGEF